MAGIRVVSSGAGTKGLQWLSELPPAEMTNAVGIKIKNSVLDMLSLRCFIFPSEGVR